VIVNLAEGVVEIHRDPDPSGRRYLSVVTRGGAERFESSAVPGYAFAIADLLA
jgi:hypothetical protein